MVNIIPSWPFKVLLSRFSIFCFFGILYSVKVQNFDIFSNFGHKNCHKIRKNQNFENRHGKYLYRYNLIDIVTRGAIFCWCRLLHRPPFWFPVNDYITGLVFSLPWVSWLHRVLWFWHLYIFMGKLCIYYIVSVHLLLYNFWKVLNKKNHQMFTIKTFKIGWNYVQN